MTILILQLLTSFTATGLITFTVTHMHMDYFTMQWGLWFLHWAVAWPIAFVTIKWISPIYKKMLDTKSAMSTVPEISIIEGRYADEFKNTAIAQEITKKYQLLYKAPKENPDTHPWLFDPINPPAGWRFDPYYEIWIRV